MYTLNNEYNHLLIIKPWKIFKRGQIIWANHVCRPLYYCPIYSSNEEVTSPTPIPQDCATDMVGTTWRLKGVSSMLYKITRYKVGNYDGRNGIIYARSYLEDLRDSEVKFNDHGIEDFINLAIWTGADKN